MDDIEPDKVSMADLVVIQRDFPRWESAYQQVLALARREGKPIIYEADDLLLELPDDHPHRPVHYYSRAIIPMLSAIMEADMVTASTPELCSYLRSFNPNIWLLPNYLADEIWPIKPPEKLTTNEPKTTVTIGYMGTTSHPADLEMVSSVLLGLLNDYPEKLALHFWGIQPPQTLANLPNVEWTPLHILEYDRFVEYFSQQTCDIFIAPLTDNPFNRCKSPLKFLEYSSLGIPGVYSRLPAYTGAIRHGENGLLAATVSDWSLCIRQLIDNPELRNNMGLQAYQTVVQDWRLSAHAQAWMDIYRRTQLANSQKENEEEQSQNILKPILTQIHEWQSELARQNAEQNQTIHDLKLNARKREEELQAESDQKERDWQARFEQHEQELQELNNRYNELNNSRAVRVTRFFWSLRSKLFPPGTHREQIWNKLTGKKQPGQ